MGLIEEAAGNSLPTVARPRPRVVGVHCKPIIIRSLQPPQDRRRVFAFARPSILQCGYWGQRRRTVSSAASRIR